MKIYIVIIFQLLIWSGFSLVEWLSQHDQLMYKGMMFFIFFYLAFLVGHRLLKSTTKSFFITTGSLMIYTSILYSLALLTH